MIARKACLLPLLALALSTATTADVASAPQAPLPPTIAGVAIPRSPLAQSAEDYVRKLEPPFLFNHSVRTFVFGALRMKALGIPYDAEKAYVAALFHDAGLIPSVSSLRSSFEIDGANAAEKFVAEHGSSKEDGRVVWNAIVMHDMGRAYEAHQSSEALLLGAGAGTDVDGADPKLFDPSTVTEVLAKVPRLQFKVQFTALATDHCRRKPRSQIGWLSDLCREVAPVKEDGSVRDEIASAPYPE